MKNIKKIIQKVSDFYEIDFNLISAMVDVESYYNPLAVRYEAHYNYLSSPHKHCKANKITVDTEITLQRMSFGLMQVMGANIREMGFLGNLVEIPSRPEEGLKYGIIHLKKQLDRYDQSIDDAVSAYNQGNNRKAENGEYENQAYVDKVIYKYLEKEF